MPGNIEIDFHGISIAFVAKKTADLNKFIRQNH